MKKVMMGILVAFLWVSLTGVASAGNSNCNTGTGTPGYWKNHPEAWPVDEEGEPKPIEVGGCWITSGDAIKLMDHPDKGNKWYTMFAALVAAKLNMAVGNRAPNCCVTSADTWMGEAWKENAVPCEKQDPPVIRARSDEWQCKGERLYLCLDEYNNGDSGYAPSRDVYDD